MAVVLGGEGRRPGHRQWSPCQGRERGVGLQQGPAPPAKAALVGHEAEGSDCGLGRALHVICAERPRRPMVSRLHHEGRATATAGSVRQAVTTRTQTPVATRALDRLESPAHMSTVPRSDHCHVVPMPRAPSPITSAWHSSRPLCQLSQVLLIR